MAKSKEEQQGLIQEKIEHLLRDNPSRSYSKEECNQQYTPHAKVVLRISNGDRPMNSHAFRFLNLTDIVLKPCHFLKAK